MKKIKWWGYLLIALGVVLLIVAGRYVYVMFIDPMSAFDAPQSAPTPAAATPIVTLPPDATPTPEPTLSPEESLLSAADMEFLKNKINILMLGWDESPERTEDADSTLYRDESNNFRSDVIILLTVDFEQKTAKLISVPRDTLAPIYNTPGHWKINAAFAKGGSAAGDGFNYAMKTVSNLLGGIPIQYYAGVNMVGVKAVVDAMGGVDYDVDVRIKLNGRVLETGYQHLDGQQVLDYCRARKGISTDVGRADRQQRMLFAIFEQLKDRNQIVNLPKIYSGVQQYINTNLNMEQIAALSVFALDLGMDDLSRYTLEGEYISKTSYSNASFYVLYADKLKQFVFDTFGLIYEPDRHYDVEYVKGKKAAAQAFAYLAAADVLQMQPTASVMTFNQQYTQLFSDFDLARQNLSALTYYDEYVAELIASPTQIEAVEAETLPSVGVDGMFYPDDALLHEYVLDDIEQARVELAEQLYLVAVNMGMCKADFAKGAPFENMMPKDVLELLPEYPMVSQPSAGGNTVNDWNTSTFGFGNYQGGGFINPEATVD